jgi:hypothetical protein
LVVALWVVLVISIWIMLPAQPRTGWQPSGDEVAVGFLSDSRSLVTAFRRFDAHRAKFCGPIQIRDVDTGEVLVSHEAGDSLFAHVAIEPGRDRLLLEEFPSKLREKSYDRNLRIYDAYSFGQIACFPCSYGGSPHWRLTSDGKTSAHLTNDEAPEIALYDIDSGRLLKTLPAGTSGMAFSADGRRLGAGRAEADSKQSYIFMVWEVPSGNEPYV